jgi:hypothetical protein
MKNLTMKSYGKLTAGLVAAWFVFALSASPCSGSRMTRIVSVSQLRSLPWRRFWYSRRGLLPRRNSGGSQCPWTRKF